MQGRREGPFPDRQNQRQRQRHSKRQREQPWQGQRPEGEEQPAPGEVTWAWKKKQRPMLWRAWRRQDLWTRAPKLFVKTTTTLPIIEFVGLLELGYTPSKLYKYDPDQLTAWRVPSGLLAWPAELVACFHHKRSFAPKRAPTLQNLRLQLNSFCNKVRRTHHFQNAPVDEFRHLRDRRPTKACPHSLSRTLRYFVGPGLA